MPKLALFELYPVSPPLPLFVSRLSDNLNMLRVATEPNPANVICEEPLRDIPALLLVDHSVRHPAVLDAVAVFVDLSLPYPAEVNRVNRDWPGVIAWACHGR